MLSAAVIAAFLDGAFIVNTARGELIDDDALVAALSSGRVAAAGLDTFSQATGPRCPLCGPNSHGLLSQLGSATVETRTAMEMRALANIDAFSQANPCRTAWFKWLSQRRRVR